MDNLNRKAEAVGNQTMWVWSMFLLVIAGGGIAIGVMIFYGYEYDLKAFEAGVLSNSISECLREGAIDFSNEQNFYSKCRLNQKVLSEEYNTTKLNIRIFKNRCEGGEIVFQLGSDFESCDFIGKNEKYQKCTRSFSEDYEKKRFEIIVGSNHLIRRSNKL